MPSYVELDKQNSFPASSSSAKIILGINDSGQAVLVDNNGNVTTIDTGGGGGVGQIPTPMIGITGVTTDLVVHFMDQGFDFTTGNPELFLFRWKKNKRKKNSNGNYRTIPSKWVHTPTQDWQVKWAGWKFFGGNQVSSFNGEVISDRVTEFEIPSTIKPYQRFNVNFNKYMFWYSQDLNTGTETWDNNVLSSGAFAPNDHDNGNFQIRLSDATDSTNMGLLGDINWLGNVVKYSLAVAIDNPNATKVNGLCPKIFGPFSEPFYSVLTPNYNDIILTKDVMNKHNRVFKARKI